MTLGDTIKYLRQSKDLTQAGLARRVDISPSYLSLLESDSREASIPLLRRLAAELGAPAAILFAAALAGDRPGLQSEVGEIIRRLSEAVARENLQEALPLPSGAVEV